MAIAKTLLTRIIAGQTPDRTGVVVRGSAPNMRCLLWRVA